LALEQPDALRDVRLHRVERLRRAVDAAGLGHGRENRKIAGVHGNSPSMSFPRKRGPTLPPPAPLRAILSGGKMGPRFRGDAKRFSYQSSRYLRSKQIIFHGGGRSLDPAP